MDEPSDRDLLVAISAKDERAFAQFLDRYLQPLQRYLLHLGCTQADAEDVAQEAFLRVWHAAERYDPQRGQVSTWLYRLAHNQLIDHWRRYNKLDAVSLQDEQLPAGAARDNGAAPDAQLTAIRDWRDLRTALTGLPMNQRSALVLRYLHGRSNEETAAVLGISVRAVESLLSRGRRQLRARQTEQEDVTRDA